MVASVLRPDRPILYGLVIESLLLDCVAVSSSAKASHLPREHRQAEYISLPVMDLAISKPLTLPCGLVLPNRLVKAAMAEQMTSASKHHLPDEAFDAVYQTWAKGGWGMILTGAVQIDPQFLNHPGDAALPSATPPTTLLTHSWHRWSSSARGTTSTTSAPPPPIPIMQLTHADRHSPAAGMGIGGTRSPCTQTLAASAVPVRLGSGWLAASVASAVFGTPRALGAPGETGAVAGRFAEAARVAAEAGWGGVEVLAGGGGLLATFLSAESNHRTDAYGGSARKRARMVVEVVEAIRKVTPEEGFCVGVKLDSADCQTGEAMEEAIEQIGAILEAGIDFLEISGGLYEDPWMMGGAGDEDEEETSAREAFFLDFARSIRGHFPSLTLMVTGGFRTRLGMEAAIAGGGTDGTSACDLVGIGRPAVLQPSAPRDVIFNPDVADEDARLREEKVEVPRWAKLSGIRAVGLGATSAWYSGQIRKLAKVK
ncbi:nadh:flavin oxidoreductase nadh oxidase [Diplodia corticola]|uniref:Nadh:flavin oxidoreductase nadh oxidase n=1 Tax=Diplodia corticola TaxID=236234 RepID=A0A1J9RAP5_9PEZI|nr:nadh:flavin oxidoreductase nadh oxidase [Diplodia corticola]OJD29491.1 nadh:flavin oxidoreductase nadh oxidase [Diplodia corticola]